MLNLIQMKNIFFTFFLLLTALPFFAQSNEQYDLKAEEFKSHFNQDKYDLIFNDFSPEMKDAVPLKDLNSFLKGIHRKYGLINKVELSDFNNGTPAIYKLEFEKNVRSLNFYLNDDYEITGLTIKAYDELANDIVNELINYPEKVSTHIYKYLRFFPEDAQVSVTILDNGEVKYYGAIRKANRIVPIENQESVFEIGSITKVFTSTVLAALVTEGEIALKDTINHYYPYSFRKGESLTFESLANHSSGLPRLPFNMDLLNRTNPFKSYDDERLKNYLEDLMRIQESNKNTYVYSNLGAGLLGHTLGLSQEMQFQDLLKKKVFDPYEMTNSFSSNEGLNARIVKGINEAGEEVSNWDFDVLFGAGGMLSTTEDLSKFAFAQFNAEDKALALTRKETFVVDENISVGLGWHLLKQKNGSLFHWHNGATGGYTSSMTLDVESEKGVIILSNISAFHSKSSKIDELGFALMEK